MNDPGGKIGSISGSINAMLDALDAQYQRTEQLERELHQREKMSALGQLVAGVVHEVKTPLAIMKTRVQMWQQALAERAGREGNLNASEVVSAESLELVVHEINRLSHLVNRLLVFSRPLADQLQRTDLVALLSHSIKLIEAEARHIAVEFDAEAAGDVPLILADKRALEQVFLNVLVNSVESIKESGTIRIDATYDRAADEVRVSVRDNGVGINPSIRDRIFDPFVTTKEKGFGLGLSVASEIVTAHGGTIDFLDTESSGAHCRISLPVDGKIKPRRSNGG